MPVLTLKNLIFIEKSLFFYKNSAN